MAVTAQLVKELRERTGAGMMDCKKALVETDGDIEKAIELLREKGLAKAAKKAGRIAAEGLVKVAMTPDHDVASIVEVNSETDFVAKNEEFVQFVDKLAEMALNAETMIWKPSDQCILKTKEPLRTLSRARSQRSAKTSTSGDSTS